MTTCPTRDPTFILLAEDEEDAVYFMRFAFQQLGLMKRHFVVNDGEEAIAYLSGAGSYGNRKNYPLPTLLLLDLKMPKMDGFDVLRWLGQRPKFRDFSVVVLSGSGEEEDRRRVEELGGDDYHVKPTGLKDLVKMVLESCQRWSPANDAVAEPSSQSNGHH